MKALICEKWLLPISESDLAKDYPTAVQFAPFFVQLKRRLADVAGGALAIEWLLSSLPKSLRVVEFFGGVGRSALIAEEVLVPLSHTVFELDQNCIDHLQRVFGACSHMSIIKADSRQVMGVADGDVFIADFNSWTLYQHIKGSDWSEPFSRLFAKDPQAVLWTDTAITHLGHNCKLYTKHFGVPIVRIEDYTALVSSYLFDMFGYTISRAAYHAGEANFLAKPGQHQAEEMWIHDRKRGFVFVD
jgi:hypothetical protein